MCQSYMVIYPGSGRLVAKSVVAQVGPHILVFQAPAFASVLDPSPAWRSKEITDDPEDNHGTKVREWVFYRGAKQAADGYEKENKK
jgi:hypothetical protein